MIKIWMGWTKRETGPDGLRCIHGDYGKAYGLQFDYRYGLIPFMQACVDHNSERYAGFKKYIAMGAGNPELIYNSGLGVLWQKYYDTYTSEFEQLQYVNAYERYYVPAAEYVKSHFGIDMDHHSPAVRGTLFSMSFRSGQETGAKKFSSCTDSTPDETMLSSAYATYGYEDSNRWTKSGQLGDALKALADNTYTELKTTMKEDDSMSNKKVLIIAGHGKNYDGSYDPGACSKWGQEATYTRELATMIEKSIGSALEVTMYPQSQNCYSYSKNGHAPDYSGYDFVLEVHFNAKTNKDPDGNGVFTGTGGYYHPNNAGRSISDAIVKAITDLGFKTWLNCTSTGLLNLNRAQAAGVKYFLLETAFIDDGDDMKWYSNHKADVAKAIAQTLINKLGGSSAAVTPATTPSKTEKIYYVQAGAFSKEANATKTLNAVKEAGFKDAFIKKSGGLYKVQAGAYSVKENAEAAVQKLKAAGIDAIIN